MRSFRLFLLASCVAANPLTKRLDRDRTAIVNLRNNTGHPAHHASGILYGIPDRQGQIPDHFYTDIGFNYARAGGAQLPTLSRGWIWGYQEYKNRFASALSNYRATRRLNGNFIFLIHDLWGIDGTQSSGVPFPGDSGDWSSWDDYLTQWISDIKANDATHGLSVDIWNEPDDTRFWSRPQQQYLDMWARTYHRLRTDLPGVLLVGPAAAQAPDLSSNWWTTYASFIAGNLSIPDQWVWHMETGKGDMLSAQAGLQSILEQYKLPSKPMNIDEYGTFNEQVPAGSAWWISQIERVDAIGLRGNWLSGLKLHDFMASLLSKPTADKTYYDPSGGDYYPNGDFQVYKYYNTNMTGLRLGTLPSANKKLDAYATADVDLVRTLVGVRGEDVVGTWSLTINDLGEVGLDQTGTLKIHTWGFPVSEDDVHYGRVNGPKDLGWADHPYSGSSVTIPIYQTDTMTAYAFEFEVGW